MTLEVLSDGFEYLLTKSDGFGGGYLAAPVEPPAPESKKPWYFTHREKPGDPK